MKTFSFRVFKSKNKRMFFLCGLGLILAMTAFNMLTKSPVSLNLYIAFGFIWLSVIVGACIVYLSPGDNEKIHSMMKIGAVLNVITAVTVNVLMVQNFSIVSLVVVDFLLLALILGYSMGLNYFYTFWRESNEK